MKRPVWAFAVVSLLCAVLMIVSTGRVDAVLGVFDAPRPISAQADTNGPAPEAPAALPDTPAVASVPDVLMAAPVGSSTSDDTGEGALTQPATAARPEKPQAAAKSDRQADKAAAKAAKKADKAAAKAAKKADRKADKAAAKAVKKADRKADKAAAKAAKKADKAAAKAAKKADKA